MFDYAVTAVAALAALTEAGGASPGLVITVKTPGAYNPATSKTTAATSTTFTGVGLVFEYNRLDSGDGTRGDSLVQAGDKQLYLAALLADGSPLPIAPVDGAQCVAPDGQTYTLKNIKPLAPAGVAVLYDITLRR